MSCDCIKACPVPNCGLEIINAGTVDPNITIISQFKDLVTGRIKQVQTTVGPEGSLQVDVTQIAHFFSPNFVYEMTLLSSNANQCSSESWTIDETEDIECLLLEFVNTGEELATVTLHIQ